VAVQERAGGVRGGSAGGMAAQGGLCGGPGSTRRRRSFARAVRVRTGCRGQLSPPHAAPGEGRFDFVVCQYCEQRYPIGRNPAPALGLRAFKSAAVDRPRTSLNRTWAGSSAPVPRNRSGHPHARPRRQRADGAVTAPSIEAKSVVIKLGSSIHHVGPQRATASQGYDLMRLSKRSGSDVHPG